uniref:Uncharacterized protein n=1 Tax=Solanum tuberosum TaxID=4113 RepID=M1E0L5_SOLTU
MFLGLTTYDRVQRPKEPSTVRRDPSVGPKPVHCLYNTDKSGKSTTPSKRVKTPVKSWLKNQPIDEEDCGLKVKYDMWDTSPIEARTTRHQAKQLEMVPKPIAATPPPPPRSTSHQNPINEVLIALFGHEDTSHVVGNHTQSDADIGDEANGRESKRERRVVETARR